MQFKGNILIAKEIARRYADQSIVSVAVNPGTYFLGYARPTF